MVGEMKEPEIVRSYEEIEKVISWIFETRDTGRSHYHGLNYEDGLLAMHDWLTGVTDDNPMG